MQAESGQMLHEIVARKERERQVGDGRFLWGVGNAPSTVIASLIRRKISVPVVFSAMKSKPKAVDMSPHRTVVWRKYIDACGIEHPLPTGALVTSRGDSAGGVKTRHYALMCYSDVPLVFSHGISFDPSAFRNASGTGAPVGASQVTALLRQVSKPASRTDYEVNMKAYLTESYWVRLSDPQELSERAISEISGFDGDAYQWQRFTERVRGISAASSYKGKQEELLL